MSLPIATKVELNLGSTAVPDWEDITAYARVEAGATITRGRRGEAAKGETAVCTVVVNNRDGRFSPRNPTGAYYGLIKRGTPLRVTVDPGSGDVVRFHGEVSEWPIGWEPSESNVWASLVAAGIRRRLGVGTEPLRDAYYRAAQAIPGLLAYWPMTDTEGDFASGVGAGSPLLTGGPIDYADNADAFPYLPALPTFQGGSAAGSLPVSATGTVSGAVLVFAPSGLGVLIHSLVLIRYTGGTVGYAELGLLSSSGEVALQLFDHSGNFISGASTGTVDDIRNRPVMIAFSVDQNGANVDLELRVISDTGADVYTDSAASLTLGTPATVGVGTGDLPSRVGPVDVAIGQLLISSALTSEIPALWDPVNGWVGEPADTRIYRLCGEEGIPVISGGLTLGNAGALMGAQVAAGLLTLLDECAYADGGILTEQIDEIGLVYTCREDLLNQDPAAVLDYGARLFEDLTPVEDDQSLVNDLTVTRTGGSSYRYQRTDGPLNVSPVPDGIGPFVSEVTVNLAGDDQLPDQTGWRLSLGTVDEARYPRIGLDLVTEAVAGVVDDVAALKEGNLLRIENPPGFAGAPDDFTQLVAGWTETITNHLWRFTITGIPGSPYSVGVYDDDGDDLIEEPGTRYSGSVAAATTEALDTTETAVDFTDPAGDWGDDDAPYDIVIGGERMTVAAVTGTGTQTFTVTRSVNGVVKTHASGAAVALYQPARYAI